MKIGIVTDSVSDISPETAMQYGIEVIPAQIIVEGESFADGKGMSREEFYTRIPNMKTPPTTAAPAPGEYHACFERLFSAGCDHIVVLHPPLVLTGIGNAASNAAEPFKGKITLVDTRLLSMGNGFQVIAAAETAMRGGSLEDVLAAVRSTFQRTRLFAALDSMLYIKRSGRVSWAAATIGSLLRLRPIVELVDGRVIRAGFARTFHEGYNRLLELLRETGKLERLAILHTNAEKQARAFLEEYQTDLPDVPFVNVTTAIGTHVGPNGLGFVAVKAK